MRKSSSSLCTLVRRWTATLLTASLCIAPGASAISFTSVPSPDLDLSQLGRVALAGDFDSISLFQFTSQNENPLTNNGSSALLGRFPTGAFATLNYTDGTIKAMCPQVQDGEYLGLLIGGNFTSVGGKNALGIARYNTTTGETTPLAGLQGQVYALLCDDDGTVYVGGNFAGIGNSTNAMIWTDGWHSLPFAGFNGEVQTITKSANGTIVFGGSFDGLGNTTTPSVPDGQVIPLGSAEVTSGSSTTTTGLSDPRNIICKTGTNSGPGNTWLLADHAPGYWQASFGFGFQPTKLRLYNTNYQGRGTRQWRFTAMPINGIMNFTYIDPSTGQNASCTSECPLPQDNTTYQDFHFVNSVGMNAFRIDISKFYGAGGGLDGIELFQDDIYSFAINDFNEPKCDGVSNGASSTATGPWIQTPSGTSTSEYLTVKYNDTSTVNPASAQVVFLPDIKQSGNYSVTVYTPGCIQDGTCTSRGQVNITGIMGSSGSQTASQPISTVLFQTNNYDKYDQVYFGYVDASSDAFQPSVTLQPAAGQVGPLTVVAQRVRFELLSNTTGGLNGLFEYDPTKATVDSEFSNNVIDSAGNDLDHGAYISQLVTEGDTIYVAGNFTGTNRDNIFAITTSGPETLSGGGLNGQVHSMFMNNSILYVGGEFTSTADNGTDDLNGIAAYSTSDQAWNPLGAGVSGIVTAIVPMALNISNVNETVLAITGTFSEVNAFGNNASFTADNFAIWVPSASNWLSNLNALAISVEGSLLTTAVIPSGDTFFAGAVSSQGLDLSDVVSLTSSNGLQLQALPVNINATASTSSSVQKRATNNTSSTQNVTGVVTGLMYHENNLNITIMGGHFAATASNGSQVYNLVFVDGKNSNTVSGIASGVSVDSAFYSLDTQDTTLFAGGVVTGNVNGEAVNGLVAWDLQSGDFVGNPPPALDGGSQVIVNAIAARPSDKTVYVGGSFAQAGSFDCPSLCVWDMDRSQWTSPGSGLSGTVSTLIWISDNELIVGGNLTIGSNSSTLATYDAKKHKFTSIDGSGALPGPVTALCTANSDGSQYWVAGQSSDGAAFLSKYDGSKWTSAGTFGDNTIIRGLQVFSLTSDHSSSDLLDTNEALLVMGQLNLPDFGKASAALYNGSDFTPFALTTSSNGTGSLSQAFVENPQNFFKTSGGHLAVGFIVLIALAIALALTFLIVVAGIVAERLRRKREGYMPAPTQMYDKSSNINRIPPEHLFSSIGASQGRVGRL